MLYMQKGAPLKNYKIFMSIKATTQRSIRFSVQPHKSVLCAILYMAM